MILETFTTTGKPPNDVVVEVLLDKWDDQPWRIQLARWFEHRGEWVHEWTGRPIHDEVVGWREKTVCGCEKLQKKDTVA